ncbi:MAG: DUF2628 domain-containing protein [Alphaproteobacteria bacterium]
MQIYSIFEPAAGPVRLDDPRSVIFLKEGFCWPALFAPLLWMLYHRMWLAAAGYVGLSAMVALLGGMLGSQEAPAALIGVGFGLIVAFEAHGLRRWQLLRNGYRQVATVASPDLPLAEARYFTNRPALPPVQTTAQPSVFAPVPERRQTAAGWGFMASDYRP